MLRSYEEMFPFSGTSISWLGVEVGAGAEDREISEGE